MLLPVVGSLTAACLASVFEFSPSAAHLDQRTTLDLFNIAVAIALIQAVAALVLAVRYHALLRNLVLVTVAVVAVWFFRGFLFGGAAIGLLTLVLIAGVLVLIFMRRQ